MFEEWATEQDFAPHIGIDAPAAARAAWQARQPEIDRIRELLREYGRHAAGCDAEVEAAYRCRCGWDEARQEVLGDA